MVLFLFGAAWEPKPGSSQSTYSREGGTWCRRRLVMNEGWGSSFTAASKPHTSVHWLLVASPPLKGCENWLHQDTGMVVTVPGKFLESMSSKRKKVALGGHQ
eukprot:1324970-Prorocentrum_lima.AAC.1